MFQNCLNQLKWIFLILCGFAVGGLLIFGLAKIAGAAWTYEQDWDNLTTGDLNGQDGWSRTYGSGTFAVQPDGAYEGKAVYIPIIAGQETVYSRSVSSTSEGEFYILWKMPTDYHKVLSFVFYNNSTQLFYISSTNYGVFSTCTLAVEANGTYGLSQNNCSSWVLIDIQYTSTNMRARTK